MSEPQDLRGPVLLAALALLAGVVITMDGCGGSTTTPSPTVTPSPAPAPVADVNGSVSANHAQPHIAVITAAQITAGSAISLNIQGMATHPHNVDLTQADLVALRNRTTVARRRVRSSASWARDWPG